MHEKLDKLSSYIESSRHVTRNPVLMYDEQILRNMNTVTTADNEEVELHNVTKDIPTYLLVAVQWSDVWKNADELRIMCSDRITENANAHERRWLRMCHVHVDGICRFGRVLLWTSCFVLATEPETISYGYITAVTKWNSTSLVSLAHDCHICIYTHMHIYFYFVTTLTYNINNNCDISD